MMKISRSYLDPRYKGIFLLLIAILITIMIDTAIARISVFTGGLKDSTQNLTIFLLLVSMFSLSQFMILKYVRVGKFITKFDRILRAAVIISQYLLIAFLVTITIQMIFVSSYSVMLLKSTVLVTYSVATLMFAVLAVRFCNWFRSKRNLLFVVYGLALLVLSFNTATTIFFVLDQLSSQRGMGTQGGMVVPLQSSLIITSSANNILSKIQLLSSIAGYIAIWISTAMILRHYTKKIGKLKFWILICLPLIYFMSQFQPFLLEFFNTYRESNPVQFTVVYTIIFNASKPIGGLMFALGLWSIARVIGNKDVKKYVTISAYGLLLFFTSNQPLALTLVPFPPFGLFTICFVGLSSYLMMSGIYFSSLSVASDNELRNGLRKMVKAEIKMIQDIGVAQMEKQIKSKVARVSKDLTNQIEKEMDIESSLEQDEIDDYVKSVIREINSRKQAQK